MSIRVAETDDIAALVELMREFYAESHFTLDSTWASGAFTTLITRPELGCAWVAEASDGPAGHGVLTVRYAMEFGALIGYIDDLYVRPAHRRRGTGRALVQALVEDARRRGCAALQVEVARTNAAARSLYERFGLQEGTDNRVLLTARFPKSEVQHRHD